MELSKCKLVLQENITIFFFESLTSKNCSFELVGTCTALMLHEYLQYICWERKQLGGACFVHVPANVSYVFISDSIQVLGS